MRLRLTFLLAAVFAQPAQAAPPVYGYKVVATYPHSTSSYTEGLLYLDGRFYEGTGLEGHSQILAEDPATGRTLQHHDLPPNVFGEGIVDWGPNLYQWTWQTHIGYVFNRATLAQVATFTYTGEGWGMTRTAHELITSDGTATLRFRNPANFAETRHIVVRDGLMPVTQLNELEYIKGEIYANVWHTNRIARISPETGKVLAWIDLSGILPLTMQLGSEAVLNGIAYDAPHDRLFVTGKQWPTIFEIKLVSPTRP